MEYCVFVCCRRVWYFFCFPPHGFNSDESSLFVSAIILYSFKVIVLLSFLSIKVKIVSGFIGIIIYFFLLFFHSHLQVCFLQR